jgi:hypothetical protein
MYLKTISPDVPRWVCYMCIPLFHNTQQYFLRCGQMIRFPFDFSFWQKSYCLNAKNECWKLDRNVLFKSIGFQFLSDSLMGMVSWERWNKLIIGLLEYDVKVWSHDTIFRPISKRFCICSRGKTNDQVFTLSEFLIDFTRIINFRCRIVWKLDGKSYHVTTPLHHIPANQLKINAIVTTIFVSRIQAWENENNLFASNKSQTKYKSSVHSKTATCIR